jgi:UDP-N-acetylmuramyl pentapeptide phosphotransferase/UDP-N-acetylglucosamine-1-phosphate transferase
VTGFGGWESLIILCAAAIGAVHGFLNYNLPVARTFMGDCGSQPLGVFIALLGVHLATVPTTYPLPLLGFVLIVSVFLYDVAYTLIKRASERKNVLQAHREHLYQRYLIATGEDHRGTLDMMEGYMIITGIAGGLYLHIAFDPAKTTRQLVLVAIAVAALVHYTIKVRRAEHRSGSELPGVAGSERISR